MAQDRGLEVDQLGARLDPELLHEGGARHRQGTQRVGLPAAPVLGQGEDGPAPLAQRFLGDQWPGLGGDPAVVAGGEPGVEQVLLDSAAQLLEPGGLAAARRPAVEGLVGPPAPRLEGPAERGDRPVVVTRGGEVTTAGRQSLEPVDVDVVVGEHEPIPARRRLDGVGSQHPSQVGDADLDLLVGRRRRILAPQGVGQLVPVHDLAPAHGQRGQREAVPGLERPVVLDRYRPQEVDPHTTRVGPRRSPVNHPDTGSIPVEVLDPYRPGGRCEQAEVPPGGQEARHSRR